MICCPWSDRGRPGRKQKVTFLKVSQGLRSGERTCKRMEERDPLFSS